MKQKSINDLEIQVIANGLIPVPFQLPDHEFSIGGAGIFLTDAGIFALCSTELLDQLVDCHSSNIIDKI